MDSSSSSPSDEELELLEEQESEPLPLLLPLEEFEPVELVELWSSSRVSWACLCEHRSLHWHWEGAEEEQLVKSLPSSSETGRDSFSQRVCSMA